MFQLGDPIPKGEEAILGGNVVAHGKVIGHYGALCKNGWTDRHAVLNEHSGGPWNHVLHGDLDLPRTRGNLWGCLGIHKHWQSSLQRSRQRGCKRDHSIANNVVLEKGSFSMLGRRK